MVSILWKENIFYIYSKTIILSSIRLIMSIKYWKCLFSTTCKVIFVRDSNNNLHHNMSPVRKRLKCILVKRNTTYTNIFDTAYLFMTPTVYLFQQHKWFSFSGKDEGEICMATATRSLSPANVMAISCEEWQCPVSDYRRRAVAQDLTKSGAVLRAVVEGYRFLLTSHLLDMTAMKKKQYFKNIHSCRRRNPNHHINVY